MPHELLAQAPLARRAEPVEPSQADYDSFCDTVMQTARGRWFLAEYARRHRNADTETVLAALRRIEASIRDGAPARQFDRLRDELRALIATIRETRTDLTATTGDFTKGAMVMALLDVLESRIAGMIEPRHGEAASPIVPLHARDDKPEAGRVHLTIVPAPEPPPTVRNEPAADAENAKADGLLPAPSYFEPAPPPAAVVAAEAVAEPPPQPEQIAPPANMTETIPAAIAATNPAELIAPLAGEPLPETFAAPPPAAVAAIEAVAEIEPQPDAPAPLATVAATIADEIAAINPDELFVPFEFEPLPDAIAAAPAPVQHAAADAAAALAVAAVAELQSQPEEPAPLTPAAEIIPAAIAATKPIEPFVPLEFEPLPDAIAAAPAPVQHATADATATLAVAAVAEPSQPEEPAPLTPAAEIIPAAIAATKPIEPFVPLEFEPLPDAIAAAPAPVQDAAANRAAAAVVVQAMAQAMALSEAERIALFT